MTLVQDEDVWTDPSDGYSVRVVRFPYSVEPEGGGCIMGFSFHTGRLWCERPGQEDPGQRSREVYIGPLVVTHYVFAETLLECGYGPDTHYLLGRKHGGFPLRLGSRPAVEALLDELKKDWQRYRRAVTTGKARLDDM